MRGKTSMTSDICLRVDDADVGLSERLMPLATILYPSSTIPQGVAAVDFDKTGEATLLAVAAPFRS
jgi:hypothetical protein